MDKIIKEQIIFALEDDNEVMTAALDPDSYLDEENKQMNRELIKLHKAILKKVEKKKPLTRDDLVLIRDANEMDLNDAANIREHHKQAIKLEQWLMGKITVGKMADDVKNSKKNCLSKR